MQKILLFAVTLGLSAAVFAKQTCAPDTAVKLSTTKLKEMFKSNGQFPTDGSLKLFIGNQISNDVLGNSADKYYVEFLTNTTFSNGEALAIGTCMVSKQSCALIGCTLRANGMTPIQL